MMSKTTARQMERAIELDSNVKYYCKLDKNSYVHITKRNNKIGNILNVSLLPTGRQFTKKDGTIFTNVKGTCSGCCDMCEYDCYAVNYCVLHNNTCIPAYAENTLIMRERPEQYFAEIEKELRKHKGAYLRVHVSGEFESYEHMKGHMDLGERTLDNGNIQYFYTKRYAWLEKLDNEGNIPENVRPTVSIWHNNYDNPNKFHEFHYDDGTDPEVTKMFHCPAVDKNGKSTGVTCDKCQRCIKAKRGMKTAVYAH